MPQIDRKVPVTKLGLLNTVNCIMFLEERFEKADKIESNDLKMLQAIADGAKGIVDHVEKLPVVQSVKFTPKGGGPPKQRV